MYFYGPPHMAEQKQDNQLEHTYSSYLRIRDVALKTCQKQWTIGRSGERGSGISMLAARHDDDMMKFSISIQFSSIWTIDRTLSGATTLGHSGPGSDDNKGVLCIPQSWVTEASPSDCLVSYPGHLLGKSYPFAGMQSVYSAAPAN